ncbi:uncharacterized protein LOC136076409 [Hydra vulgaris]|uniref:Uncharacterized protein LOC136076409 n=1 Tax=Hydra vulgaris TaxID=6087 RepID=A0ABM4BAF4_HYDVU
MRSAFKEFGIYQIAHSLPAILQLFNSCDVEKLTFKRLSTLLKPSFAEIGSNDYVFQSKIYAKFNKYLREAASGRRNGVTLERVLQFVTGAEAEPVLGYELHPSISFIGAENGWIPTSNTCSSVLNLPRPSIENKIPLEEKLFRLYDYAFNNAFFGIL